MAQRLEAASPWRPVSDLPALTNAPRRHWPRLEKVAAETLEAQDKGVYRVPMALSGRYFTVRQAGGIPEAIRHGNTLSRSCVDSLIRSAVVSRKRTSSGGSKKGYIDYDVERQIPLRIEDKIYTASHGEYSVSAF
jgi:hypothetical protein